MPENRLLPYSDISLLYVEDDAATREQVSRILSARGYRLTVAENGEQGLACFREQPSDIVLTDIMMPRLNGLEMARALRVLSPEIQITCMTAFSDTSYLIEAIEIGINQFVLKPVEFNSLFTALDRCQKMVELDRRQRRLEAENIQIKKIEAIGILAGGMAHDFNNLLQVILGYVSLARMNAEPGSKIESLLAVVENTSETARELGKRLLMLASGGDVLMLPTNLEHLLQSGAAAELRMTAIKQFVDLPGNLPPVLLDTGQIQQVITNLVVNAREAMPDGGSLHISASVPTLSAINVFGLPQGDYLQVVFEDTGIGITPENLPKIFDPYFSTKEMGSQKGMGLGLALSYAIIKHHRGHIHAESRQGEGTRIHIYLPVYHSNG